MSSQSSDNNAPRITRKSVAHRAETGLVLAALTFFPATGCSLNPFRVDLGKESLAKLSIDPDRESDFQHSYFSGYRIAYENIRVLKQLLGSDRKGSISIEIIPEGQQPPIPPAPFPSAMRYYIPAMRIEPTLTDYLLHGFSPLVINGRVMSVEISLRASAQEKARYAEGVTELMDAFGNCVELDNRHAGELRLEIRLPTAFTKDEGIENEYADRPIDLSCIGLGQLKGCIFTRVERPLLRMGVEGCYRVYANMDHEEVRGLFSPYSSSVAQAIYKIELLFGACSGEQIQQIAVINERTPHGYYQQENPHAIVINDEYFRIGVEDSSQVNHLVSQVIPCIAAHESGHNFDYKYRLSFEEFAEWFEQAKEVAGFERFCEELNEKNFLSMGRIGHCFDNPTEFVASLISSFTWLSSLEWQEVMAKHDDEFRSWYLKALEMLSARVDKVVESGKLPEEALIVTLVPEMIEHLHKQVPDQS